MTVANELKEHQAHNLSQDPIIDAVAAHPVGTGIGAATGAVAGAVMGTIGGPIGAAIGGVIGAVAGGIAGRDAGELFNPTGVDVYWTNAYRNEPYYDNLYTYEDYAPAYRAAHFHRLGNYDGLWDQAEIELKSAWEHSKATSRLKWEQARHAARAAWHRVDRPHTGADPDDSPKSGAA